MLNVSSFPFPLLVGDIGGTNARFAIVDAPGAPLRILARAQTAEYSGVADAILAAIADEHTRPRSAILCGAGPVTGRTLALTNAPWVLDGPELVRQAVVEQGLLLNDFEAQALALPAIPPEFLEQIGPQIAPGSGPLDVLGPGTGLGIGALLQLDGRFVPVPSEACHISFGPDSEDEWAYWPHLPRARGRITTESVMSGVGLQRIHLARAAARGRSVDLDGPAIVAKGLADPASDEAETCRCFVRLIARFAGDIAITFLATGGVTLAGGILPRIRPLIDHVEFRSRFESKAPVDGLAKRIGTRLVTEPDAVLTGMVAIGERPAQYAINYGQRLWGPA